MRRAVGVLLALLATSALAGCGEHESRRSHALARSTWPAPNADLANTRRVGGPIDAASVSRLARAWAVPVESYAATPVVVDGVVYTQDLSSSVLAIDLQSGDVRWRKRYDELVLGPNGVNVHGGRVYGATATKAFALDARTGRQLWRRSLVANRAEGIDMAPGFHDGSVYVSTVPVNPSTSIYGPGARGTLWALDADTGAKRWTWATVPAGLWGRPEINSGGGLWHPPAFDEHGSLYVATANPAPFPGVYGFPAGSSRPGPNRWTNAIVKLDERTGKRVWARQVLPHDLYDWDLECPVILADAGTRPIAVTGGKMGFVYAFDRDDGELVWKTSVGLHNGHDDDNLRAMRGELAGFRSRTKVLPGVFGGVETQLAADADTVYVPVVNLPAVYSIAKTAEPEPFSDATGELLALDLATGRVKWDRKLPQAVFGAATVANDLVFTTTYDGTIWALRTRTGEIAWKARLPSNTTATVAIAGDTLLTASTGGIPEGKTNVIAYRLRARD
ncbi:MAG: PQQ-binding-like beta-propeller repeat protein [Conexibacter sp.]